MIRLGTSTPTKFYVGNSTIGRIYLGSNLIYNTGSVPDFNPPAGTYRNIQLVSNQNMNAGNISNEMVRFVPGNYSNIYLELGTLNNVIIDFTGVTLTDCLVELGSGNNNKIYGLGMRDMNNAPFRINFGNNNLQLISFNFDNCYNGPISFTNLLDYNGSDATLNQGFKVLNSTFTDCDGISMDGHLEEGRDDGLFKDFEIAYNTFTEMPTAGKVLSAQNSWNYNVHHNTINNINQQNDNHNGVFEINGNGKFHHNKLTNYQGNSIRMWLFSRGNTPQLCEIYNNICYNTRKYSGFELQEFSRFIQPGKTTYANAAVYNNTVGRMNTTIPYVFEGQILDLYNISGSLQYYNNLGFELQKQSGAITDMINYNGNSTPDVIPVNNVYKATWQEAVTDLSSFTSLINGVGA